MRLAATQHLPNPCSRLNRWWEQWQDAQSGFAVELTGTRERQQLRWSVRILLENKETHEKAMMTFPNLTHVKKAFLHKACYKILVFCLWESWGVVIDKIKLSMQKRMHHLERQKAPKQHCTALPHSMLLLLLDIIFGSCIQYSELLQTLTFFSQDCLCIFGQFLASKRKMTL